MLPSQQKQTALLMQKSFETIEIEAMRRCFKLALLGRRMVAPNPMVGAVLIHQDSIVAEGFHQRHGAAHAETEAIAALKDSSILPNSTLVVSLEPCSHFGRTPPCADFIVKSKIPRVIIGARDTSPKVNGAGIAKLSAAGIEVKTGLLEEEARSLNRRFFTFHERGRPYVILKWAQTEDGFISSDNPVSRWISSEESRALVHEWRAEEAAVMVGTETARVDNPKLTARPASDGEVRQPLRVVVDRHQKLPRELSLFDASADTIIFNAEQDEITNNLRRTKIDFSSDVIKQILQYLHHLRITSLLVEGGARLLQSFLAADLWDEACVFTAPKKYLSGIKAPLLPIKPFCRQQVGPDELSIYNNSSFKMYEFLKA